MFLNDRIDRIVELMLEKRIDALVLGPSSDLQYLTGLSPLSDERFKALIVLADRQYFHICPELYYEETREMLGQNADIFVWSDSAGFLTAVEKADRKYGLKNKSIGINDGIRAVDLLDMQSIMAAAFVNGSSVMEELRVIKTHEERGYLRKAAQIADEVAAEIVKFIRPGITERHIKKKIEELFIEKGGQGESFDAIVASGPNSSKPHYNKDTRVIEERDVIILDFGCKYNGYCSDMSRTVFVGEPEEEQRRIYNIVLEANDKAEAYAREGVTAEDVDISARNVIRDAGYGECFLNRTGHGIGTAVHEAPYIKEGNKQVLKDGMAFSIEPGIYVAGRFGMRVEDIVLINEGKAEVLNKFTKDIIIIK